MSQARQRRGDGRGGGGDGAPPLPDGGDGGGSSDRSGGGGGEAPGGDAARASLPVRLARQCWGHLVVLYVWLAAGGCSAALDGRGGGGRDFFFFVGGLVAAPCGRRVNVAGSRAPPLSLFVSSL